MRKPTNRDRGWKQDPKDPTRVRFWNGITWTQQIMNATPEQAEAFAAAERGEDVDLPDLPAYSPATSAHAQPAADRRDESRLIPVAVVALVLVAGIWWLSRGDDEPPAEAQRSLRAAKTYREARDVCGAFPAEKVASDLGIPGTDSHDLIAETFAQGYEGWEHYRAAYDGCFDGLE